MKILIELMHGMGDLVCALPMVKEVRENFPDSYITVLVNRESNKDILTCSGILIDNYVVIDVHHKKMEALLKCMELRSRKYDLAISCVNTPVRKSKLMMMLIGAKRKMGIQFSSNKSLLDLNEQYHFVDAHIKALEGLSTKSHNYMPQLVADPKVVMKIQKIVHRYVNEKNVGICIGRADISYRNKRKRTEPVYTRGWGELEQHVENMQELIKKCLIHRWKVILIGGLAEEKIRDMLANEILSNCNVFDFVGKTSVEESIALVSECDIVIGIDTGMQHVADAVGVPTISLFGPTNPKTHGAYSERARFVEVEEPCKYCFGTTNYEWCKDRKCMKRISVEQVFNIAVSTLEK